MTFFMTKWARKDLDRFSKSVKKRMVKVLRELSDSDRGDVDVWRMISTALESETIESSMV